MKTTVHDNFINCPKHGEVPFPGVRDLGRVSTMYCPKCVEEAHNHISLKRKASRFRD